MRHFNRSGLDASGFDGNPSTPQLSKGSCSVFDLSHVAEVRAPFDWVMSLEVGEHLPKEHEDAFMENLHRHNVHGIVLSWATVGQGGTGHVNEQDNEYIKAKICGKGYTSDVKAELVLRKSARLNFFQNTLMVFRKSEDSGVTEAVAKHRGITNSSPRLLAGRRKLEPLVLLRGGMHG